MMEEWKSGRVEEWKSGRVEEWKSGRVEEWKSGRVEEWKSGRRSVLPAFPSFQWSTIPLPTVSVRTG
jgi:hypothetical protein